MSGKIVISYVIQCIMIVSLVAVAIFYIRLGIKNRAERKRQGIQKRTISKKLKMALLIAGIPLGIYILMSVAYGFYFNNLFYEVYRSNGTYTKELSQKVSKEMYESLDFKSWDYADEEVPYTEYVQITFPIVLHWFAGGRADYWYSYERTDKKTGEYLNGNSDVRVKINFHLQNRQIMIDEKYEAP
jgi:heme/copper-type cytochrome/quinol oxidase subunit 2